MPVASYAGSVVQSSAPTVWASTKKKSQPDSMSRPVSKASEAPLAGTSMTWVRRLYADWAAAPE